MSASTPPDTILGLVDADADAPPGEAKAATAGNARASAGPPARGDAEPVPEGVEQLLNEMNESLLELMWRFRQEADQACSPFGLNPLRAFILTLLERETLHPKALADMLDLAPPAVSHLLNDLEERSLILRRNDENDRRRVKLELTDQGAETAAQLRATWNRMGAQRLQVLDEDEIRTLLAIHRKLLGELQP